MPSQFSIQAIKDRTCNCLLSRKGLKVYLWTAFKPGSSCNKYCMYANQVNAKKDKFCAACAKRGIASELVQFSVSFKETVFLCVQRDCFFPFGHVHISCFCERKKCKERALFSDKANFAEQICFSSGGHEKYFNTHGTSLEQWLIHLKNEKLRLLEKVDWKSSGFIPVRRDKWFFSCRRSRVTFFKPYISAKRQLCSSSSLAIESNIDHSSTCMQEAQDLSQCNKELTRDEEQFLVDVVFKWMKCYMTV